jgi:two-component system, OmpR family, alkaline phosphatase synthesis response regulator PhoP
VNRLLIVDDDHALVNLLKRFLEGEGFSVDAAYDHASGLSAALSRDHELVVLDVMLPGGSGFELLKALRQQSSVPVLLLTARGEAVDRILGLEIGADDYLAKPFDPRELLARVEALLRRVRKDRRIPVRTFEFSDVQVDFERAEVRRAGQPVSMASKELQLLQYLVHHRDRVVPREEILQKVWEYASEVSSRTIDVHVAWLRQKLDNPQSPKHIQTIRGKGYRFTA